MEEREYLDVLIRSLQKKLVLLNRIAILSKEQRELLLDSIEQSLLSLGGVEQVQILVEGTDTGSPQTR